MARGFGVSLNDVVLAICAGALRELLLAAEKLPRAPLVAAMPVSLREAGNQQVDNQVSMVQCSLATDIADPLERLRAIHASTAQIKQRVATFKGLIPTDFPGLAAPLWAAGLSRLWGTRPHRRAPAGAGQRRHLQRARPAGAAVPRRREAAPLLSGVDRDPWAGVQHHRAKLCGQPGVRADRLQGRGRPARHRRRRHVDRPHTN